jgi:hypothetical protein
MRHQADGLTEQTLLTLWDTFTAPVDLHELFQVALMIWCIWKVTETGRQTYDCTTRRHSRKEEGKEDGKEEEKDGRVSICAQQTLFQ